MDTRKNLLKTNFFKTKTNVAFYLLVALTLSGSACQSNQQAADSNSIDSIPLNLQKKDVYASTLFDSVEYIVLSDDMLIGNHPVITILKNHLLVQDRTIENPRTLIFGMDGKFKYQISSLGNAGFEHSSTVQTLYHEASDQFYLFDKQKNKFLIFTFDGDFVKEFKVENSDVNNNALIFNDQILIYRTNPTLNEFNGFSDLLVLDMEGNEVAKHAYALPLEVRPLTREEQYQGLFPMSNYFRRDGDKLTYFSSISDTVYEVNSDFTMKPKMVFHPHIPEDWPPNKFPDKELPLMYPIYMRIGNILYFKDLMVNRNKSQIVYHLDNKESYFLGDYITTEINREYPIYGWMNDLNGGAPIGGGWDSYLTDKNTKLIQHYSPKTFKALLRQGNRRPGDTIIRNQEAHQRLLQWAEQLDDMGNYVVQIAHIRKDLLP
jgi:hypothetical protein